MATDADIEKAAADKRIADEATASAAAAANWPTGGYNMFIPLLIISMSTVLVICVDSSTICLVHEKMIKYQHVLSIVHVILMIYSWINLIGKLLIFTTLIGGCRTSLYTATMLDSERYATRAGDPAARCTLLTPILSSTSKLPPAKILPFNHSRSCFLVTEARFFASNYVCLSVVFPQLCAYQ